MTAVAAAPAVVLAASAAQAVVVTATAAPAVIMTAAAAPAVVYWVVGCRVKGPFSGVMPKDI